MSIPEMLKHGTLSDPFYVEYVKRVGQYNMLENHFHPYYEIYYLLSGERLYFIKDTSYPVQKGDLVFINKNELHKTLQAGEPSHERIIMHFDDTFIHSAFPQQANFLLSPFHQKSHVLRLSQKEQSQIEALMLRTIEELQHKPSGCEVFLFHTIVDLLLIAARFLQKNESESIPYATPMHKRISEIVRYININYAEMINLSLLSEQFFISSFYLSRLFKEITGFSFTDYLNHTRVREAQRLLRESDIKIIEIAANVGFESFSHFGKIFKKIAHISPRTYRQDSKGNHLF